MRFAWAVVLALGIPCTTACIIETEPAPRRPLLRDTLRPPPSGAPATSAAPSASSAASPAPASPTVSPTAAPPAEALRTCETDGDCVAVLPNGCCKDGRNVALRRDGVDAYRGSFTCPTPNPICPMHLVLDRRLPACDLGSHTCVLVDPPPVP